MQLPPFIFHLASIITGQDEGRTWQVRPLFNVAQKVRISEY
jgi:hypothetical protein